MGSLKTYSLFIGSHNTKLPFAHPELTVYMQNQLKVCSFVGTKVGFSHDVPFSSYARAMK